MATALFPTTNEYCALPLCGLEAGPNVVLYPLPEEEPLRQAWITFVHRCPGGGGRGWVPQADEQSFVCSLHFAFNSFVYRHSSAVKKWLRTDAVPTVYPRRGRRRMFLRARTMSATRRYAGLQGTMFPERPARSVHQPSRPLGEGGGNKAADNWGRCTSADASTQCRANVNVKAVQCVLVPKWSMCMQTSARTQNKLKDAACCTDDCLDGCSSDLEEGGNVPAEEARIKDGLHSLPRGESSPQPYETATRRPLGRCYFCPYTSMNLSLLQKHLLVHTGGKPFECKDCSVAFKTRVGYQDHVSCHTGGKRYKCSQCPFASSRSYLLVRHMKIHTSEKHFVCTLCSYVFLRSDLLKRHMTVMHMSYRPHMCTVCGYASANRSCAVRHAKMHCTVNSDLSELQGT